MHQNITYISIRQIYTTMRKTYFLLVFSFILSSCSTYNANTNTGSSLTHLYLRIFQTLNEHEALAFTRSYDVVKIITDSDIYFDDKKVYGDFKLVDTYNYTTTKGIKKTVPVYKCMGESSYSFYNYYGQQKKLSVKIFQTLDEHEALAFTGNNQVVKLETSSEVYYDGKKVTGKFCLSGIYQYITTDTLQKTVPVYIRAEEYTQYE